MEAKEFIKNVRKWDENETGHFDFNGVVSLLEDFKNEISKDFESSSRTVIKYLCENHHPHVTVVITQTNAELLEGKISTGQIMDYVRD